MRQILNRSTGRANRAVAGFATPPTALPRAVPACRAGRSRFAASAHPLVAALPAGRLVTQRIGCATGGRAGAPCATSVASRPRPSSSASAASRAWRIAPARCAGVANDPPIARCSRTQARVALAAIKGRGRSP